jgi:lipid A 4'-phosphatase
LLVSEALYAGGGKFAGHSLRWVEVSRTLFIIFFWCCAGVAIAGLWATRLSGDRWLHLTHAQWIFFAICLAVGPGFVANLALKDHWGRARPKHVLEFGGDKNFTAPLVPTNQCARNCSFISGEAASAFVPFYAAAFVVPQWSASLVVAGTLCGLAAGLVRMAQGGHFLSDVIFAGVFMALTVSLAHKLMLTRTTRRWLRPSGIGHRVKRICTREGVLLERRVRDGLDLIATLRRPDFDEAQRERSLSSLKRKSESDKLRQHQVGGPRSRLQGQDRPEARCRA